MSKRFPNIGMGPAVWGPIVWTTMHIMSLGYSPMPTAEEKAAAIDFYTSLATIIPCPICRKHYKVHLQEMPIEPAVENRDTLIEWVFNVHNKVNEQLGKPTITFDEYIEKMTRLSQRDHFHIHSASTNTWTIPAAVVLGGVTGIVAYHVYQSRFR